MRLILLTPIALLAACADPAETCSSYGFEPGSVAYANCQMQVSESNSERAYAVSDSLKGLTMSGQQNNFPSPPVTCRYFPGGYQCR
jgi:hypothetical protein